MNRDLQQKDGWLTLDLGRDTGMSVFGFHQHKVKP